MRGSLGFASWHILIALTLLAAILLVIQRSAANHDVELATGPSTSEQAEFFAKAADRPDLDLFFKALKPAQQIKMAANLGSHPTAGAARTAARLLATPNDKAREELTKALIRIAMQKPELIAAELGRSGSYERLGIFRALASTGSKGIEEAAKALGDPGRKDNAILFLVQTGQVAIPHLLPLLKDVKEEVRTASAEALGKLRAPEAVGGLEALYLKGGADSRTYLFAMAQIGDPQSEKAIQKELSSAEANETVPLYEGLGRISSPTAIARLERAFQMGSTEVRKSVIEAITLGEDRALKLLKSPVLQLEVASRLETKLAEEIIRQFLSDPALVKNAIEASKGRPSLAGALWRSGTSPSDPTISLRMEALSSTPEGRAILHGLECDSKFGGFAKRALVLAEP